MDFQSAQAAQLDSIPDPTVLALTARDGRILVTHDVRTMPSHFSDVLAEDKSFQEYLSFLNTHLLPEPLRTCVLSGRLHKRRSGTAVWSGYRFSRPSPQLFHDFL